jgi:hypothetical protein
MILTNVKKNLEQLVNKTNFWLFKNEKKIILGLNCLAAPAMGYIGYKYISRAINGEATIAEHLSYATLFIVMYLQPKLIRYKNKHYRRPIIIDERDHFY